MVEKFPEVSEDLLAAVNKVDAVSDKASLLPRLAEAVEVLLVEAVPVALCDPDAPGESPSLEQRASDDRPTTAIAMRDA